MNAFFILFNKFIIIYVCMYMYKLSFFWFMWQVCVCVYVCVEVWVFVCPSNDWSHVHKICKYPAAKWVVHEICVNEIWKHFFLPKNMQRSAHICNKYLCLC